MGLEYIVPPTNESSRETRGDFDSLGVGCQGVGITGRCTPSEIIEIELEGLDVRPSSSTAELERSRNILETPRSRVAVLDNEASNCFKEVRETAVSKSTLDNKVIGDGTCLKEVIDTSTVQHARLRSIEDERNSLRRQYSLQTSSLYSAHVASAQFKAALDNFSQAMQA